MDTRQAYNHWASQYDEDENKTRDLEASALRDCLSQVDFNYCLEIGCGTGKNTASLMQKAHVDAIDFSEEMLSRAKQKIQSDRVRFFQADIRHEWTFREKIYDLVVFSLVLEHIEQLDPVFRKASESLRPGGHVYVGELHPFKQYTGSRAKFDNADGRQSPECFNHHISDFIRAAMNNGLQLVQLDEHSDNDGQQDLPRILTLLLKKTMDHRR